MVGPGPPQCLFVESVPHTDHRICGVVADGGGTLPVQVYLEKTQSLLVIHSFFFLATKLLRHYIVLVGRVSVIANTGGAKQTWR